MTCGRKIAMLFIITVSCSVGDTSRAQPSNENAQSPQLRDYLPLKVNLLRESLNHNVLAGKSNCANSNDKYTRRAQEQAFQWVLKTINADWLPEDPNVLRKDVIMVRDVFGPNDVAVFQWEKHRHVITVAQTRTILLIQVRIKDPGSTPQFTATSAKSHARDVVSRILRQEVEVEVVEATSSKIVKKTIGPILLRASFEQANIKEYVNGIHGKCGGPGDQYDPDYGFWWRRVSWWTDGNVVGVYTLKTEGGAWRANYAGRMDGHWF